jgi:hypothetical protein
MVPLKLDVVDDTQKARSRLAPPHHKRKALAFLVTGTPRIRCGSFVVVFNT